MGTSLAKIDLCVAKDHCWVKKGTAPVFSTEKFSRQQQQILPKPYLWYKIKAEFGK